MKKLLAILLSALMLCTMIPFATVSAADEGITIVVEVSEEQVNAGDEFEVTVYLEGNPGVMGVGIKILFDTDAMELVGEWDGEDFYPEISHPKKWKAAGFTYGPNEKTCVVNYTMGTATSNVTEEEYFTAVFVAKEDAYTGDYDLTVKYNPANFFGIGFTDVAVLGVENGTIHINGTEPPCEHEYQYDCSKVCSLCGEETRPEAEHAYFYPCDQHCMNCGEMTNPDADHTITHIEAKDAVSCIEYGNREYWTCEDCGGAWLDENLIRQTNLMSVRVAGACVSDAENACQDGVCVNCGLPVSAEVEHEYFYPCDQYCMNCSELTNPEAAHNITHVDAVAPTCTENGNIEYWTCADCSGCWDNESAEGIPLNRMMIIAWAEGHVYDDDADLECNVCGYIREVLTPIAVLGNLGTAVSEDVNGLGFGFSVNVVDVMVENGNEFVAGAVIPFNNEEIYNLAGMGAILSNDTDIELVLENVDDSRTKNVPALLLSDANTEDDQIEFAVRVVNIPNIGKNAVISARPYFIYTTIEGEEIVVYGDTISCSYNEAMELIPIG